ncbi:MAG TPA: thioredoxin family protein [Chryseolinea sp.]|nr:thioredoxin family protein [Chryseolinea sp.]HPH46185.1 thioredoxin family protein [Chryseolinea sp.]HPM29983.1 thioredoxin family protein [Chryseolinea sp.]
MKTLMISLVMMVTLSTEWLTNMTAAKEIAAKENKYILLNFSGSDWCAPCIKMKKEVFENESFLNLAEKQLILVRADFPRSKKNKLSDEQTKHNEALAEKYNPSGKFPLTILLDANGKVIKEWDGYAFSSQDKFIADLDTVLTLNK